MNNKEKVQAIIDEIDRSTLLGAAYDCISEQGKIRFQDKIENILENNDE